ncbi:hypothetical protein [Calidifontibacillus oryziterrae]|uniref:hypothetical protein n=1 Tax=Calidifontibacillus oryziterrae TaxID=1191699 RepID=UPI000363D4B0|nr:hypothetical protein [Calidifontibacillus oryziterrae]
MKKIYHLGLYDWTDARKSEKIGNSKRGHVVMFDPTIFENLKVVAEGAVYDLDLIGQIVVTNRVDQVDLAKLSRHYSITFRRADVSQNSVQGKLQIDVGAHDLSSEILEKDIEDNDLGCTVEVTFFTKVNDIENDCSAIQLSLLTIWGNRPSITQQLSFFYEDRTKQLSNSICLKFDRKIAEAQVGDLPIIVDHMVESIDRLNEILNKN